MPHIKIERFYIPASWDFKNATNLELFQIWSGSPGSTVLREIIIEMEMRKMLSLNRIPGMGYPMPLDPRRRNSEHRPQWTRVENDYAHVLMTREEAMKSLGIPEE